MRQTAVTCLMVLFLCLFIIFGFGIITPSDAKWKSLEWLHGLKSCNNYPLQLQRISINETIERIDDIDQVYFDISIPRCAFIDPPQDSFIILWETLAKKISQHLMTDEIVDQQNETLYATGNLQDPYRMLQNEQYLHDETGDGQDHQNCWTVARPSKLEDVVNWFITPLQIAATSIKNRPYQSKTGYLSIVAQNDGADFGGFESNGVSQSHLPYYLQNSKKVECTFHEGQNWCVFTWAAQQEHPLLLKRVYRLKIMHDDFKNDPKRKEIITSLCGLGLISVIIFFIYVFAIAKKSTETADIGEATPFLHV